MIQLPQLPEPLIAFDPEIGLILGSGLGFFANSQMDVVGRLPYEDLPGFPVSTVSGHTGQFVYGTLCGKRVICMEGRFHYYEGYTMPQLALPIRLMNRLGVTTLLITNAAGGIHPDYAPGDFMMLSDHINLLGTNPLIAWDAQDGIRFPDMTEVYDPALRKRIRDWSQSHGFGLKEGVYLATTGPSFETPAEIRAFATLGADAVGMSTVPEAIVARKFDMRVCGFSCITNTAAGISSTRLSHKDVFETANRVRPQFAELLAATIRLL